MKNHQGNEINPQFPQKMETLSEIQDRKKKFPKKRVEIIFRKRNKIKIQNMEN